MVWYLLPRMEFDESMIAKRRLRLKVGYIDAPNSNSDFPR